MAKTSLPESELLYEGVWWVPGTPEQKVYGELSLDPDSGLRLRLKVAEGYARVGWKPLKVVHGTDQHGKPVTLFYATCVNSAEQGAVTAITYSVGYCFHGAHFLKWSEVVFDEVEVEFTYLQDWIDISGFVPTGHKDGESSVHYRLPDDMEFHCSGAFSLVLAARVTTKSERGDFKSIRQRWFMRLKYKKLQPFKQIRRDLMIIRRFLTLGVGKKVAQKSLDLSQSKSDLKFGGKRLRHPIISHTRRTHLPEEDQREHGMMMPFSFTRIRADFEGILRRWFSYQDLVNDPIHLYFSTIENPHLYSNHIVLFLAQALEVYHRSLPKKFPQDAESKTAFRQRLQRLTREMSKADAKWLRAALAYANQPTLNTRLLQIFEEKRKYLGSFLGDEAKFAERVRHTRNHFTHWGQTKSKHVVPDEEMFPFIHQLQTVLKVCFLSDIGMPDQIIREAVKKFSWTVINFTEDDSDEPGERPDLALPAPVKKGKKQK